jgi:hypothetical protein
MAAVPGAELQEKIAAARREADALKEQIRSRKDKMADTSCEYSCDRHAACRELITTLQCERWRPRSRRCRASS